MVKEALQYIVGLSQPNIKEIGGETYSDKALSRIVHIKEYLDRELSGFKQFTVIA